MTIFKRIGLPIAAIGLFIGFAAPVLAASGASGYKASNYTPPGYPVTIGSKEQAFIDAYVGAINSHDWEKFKALLPASSQACMTTDVPRYKDVMSLNIPDTRQIEIVKKHTDMAAMPLAQYGMKLPADVTHGTHIMNISFVDTAASKDGVVSSKGITEALLDVNDKYLLVLACPMTEAEKAAAAPKEPEQEPVPTP
jgi:hypothetical protein